jgi:hypothetical protein
MRKQVRKFEARVSVVGVVKRGGETEMKYSKQRNQRRIRKLEQAAQDEVVKQALSEIDHEGRVIIHTIYQRLAESSDAECDSILRTLKSEEQGLYGRLNLRLTQLAHERGISLD